MSRIACLGLLLSALPTFAAPPTGFTPEVKVSSPTRLDWTFVVSNRSLVKPPDDFLGDGYDSTKQTYDLFVPTTKTKQPKAGLPAILFISPGNDSQGWKGCEPFCTAQNFVFIGVRGAGNEVKGPKRVRIILDCFDDVRRQVPLDPDRTYVAGISGGARMACSVAFALPEYFGGIMPVVAGGDMRDEPWLRHRIIDRLSIAAITGQTDFNRGEVERWKKTFWKELGIRSKVWVVNNMGHSMAPASIVTEALKWLEEGKAKRQELAKTYPAMRAASPAGVLSREQAAQALFDEGKHKLDKPETVHAGQILLKGCAERWPDLETGIAAKKLFNESVAKPDRPGEKEDIAEQLKYLVADARALSDYALNGIPPKSMYSKQQPDIAGAAIRFWQQIIAAAPDSEVAKEGKKLVPELEKLTGKGK
jgi:predicted esterase